MLYGLTVKEEIHITETESEPIKANLEHTWLPLQHHLML